MSVHYVSVHWNKQKKVYDLILWAGIVLFMSSLVAFQFIYYPEITLQTLVIRTTAITAFLLLHIILLIGPLCRIDPRFLPLLYNRRHLGVSMFLIALVHGFISIVQFHTLGDTGPFVSLLTSNENYRSISEFPFQILGFLALIILFIMAATSHDFWLKTLSPPIWKALHMGVYIAYGLITMHVITGALQYENNPVYWTALVIGFTTIAGAHIFTGIIEYKKVQTFSRLKKDGFYKVCTLQEIEEDFGKPFFINGENIAIFKYDQKIAAVNNICKHQMGPIGEGKIIDGCITCPWHGYQYIPENGQSPPPFNEKLATYETRIFNGHIWINPYPHGEGNYVDPSKIEKE